MTVGMSRFDVDTVRMKPFLLSPTILLVLVLVAATSIWERDPGVIPG